MPRKPTTREMSDAHEKYLVDLIGGKQMRNSGAVWSQQMDVRNPTGTPFAFALDGKSTFNDSISISRSKMWTKAREQSHNERTGLPLRWYDDYRLTVGLDLIVITTDDFAEMREIAVNCVCQ